MNLYNIKGQRMVQNIPYHRFFLNSVLFLNLLIDKCTLISKLHNFETGRKRVTRTSRPCIKCYTSLKVERPQHLFKGVPQDCSCAP